MGTIPDRLERRFPYLLTIDDQFDASRITDSSVFVMLYYRDGQWYIDEVPSPNADARASTPVSNTSRRWEEAAKYALDKNLPLLTYSKKPRETAAE